MGFNGETLRLRSRRGLLGQLLAGCEGVQADAAHRGDIRRALEDLKVKGGRRLLRFVHLCSERADHLRSQLVTFNGSKLGLWQHPRETWVRRQDSWTDDELAAALDGADEAVYRPEM